jgi:hypothetical protein
MAENTGELLAVDGEAAGAEKNREQEIPAS